MGFLRRQQDKARTTQAEANLYAGTEALDVVGESHYQDVLWLLVGDRSSSAVRHAVYAVLVPESSNPHDPNAVSVQINGQVVGYLSRQDAVSYRPGLLALMQSGNCYVALEGFIIGGGPGRASLGVFLNHDPTDFGLQGPAATPGHEGEPRTGFSEARGADHSGDHHNLSWYNELPDGDRAAIEKLRELLPAATDVLDRHFMFNELEARLYRSRDLYPTALDEYDEACRIHDEQMEGICLEFRSKWGEIPVLDTYRQMCIRQQKQQNWQGVIWWADRGLHLYGEDAGRESAVEDLTKRRNRAGAKISSAESQGSTAPSAPSDAPTAASERH